MNGSELGSEVVSQTPQYFLTEGNKHFILKKFTSAIASYTKGLIAWDEVTEAHCDFENEPRNKSTNGSAVFLELLSNRGLAYLSIENFPKALADCEKVLSREEQHFKGILRKAKALVGLERYEIAITFLNEVGRKIGWKSKSSKISPEHWQELKGYLEKVKRMKDQAETGDWYDIPAIMEKVHERAPQDWVDYVGQVKVQNSPGRGRGLVATEDLPGAKLVLASRAFEIIFLEEGDPEEGMSEESREAMANGDFKKEDDATLNLLARKIYDRLVRNPEKREEFYQLHAGNDLGHLDPVVKSSPEDSPPPLDMARIYGICRTNTFANAGDSYPEVEKSVGLWLFPAYVNHQCIGGNCTWKIFGDYIFVRTFKPVKKGEELIHSYVSPAFPFRARTEVLTKRLGFVCMCVLCELDRSLGKDVQLEKDKLKQLTFNQEVTFSQLDPSDSGHYGKRVQSSILILEQIISKLEKIQPKHGAYNASLLDPLQKLGLKYFGVGDFQKTVKVMERACALMKACILPHGVVDCAMWIIAGYLQMGNGKQAKKWGKVLRENLILAYGDVHVLKVLGEWTIDPMTEWGLMK